MPLYEYLCESCGERTEILQRFNDLPEVACPKCGEPMRRLRTAPTIGLRAGSADSAPASPAAASAAPSAPAAGSAKGPSGSGGE